MFHIYRHYDSQWRQVFRTQGEQVLDVLEYKTFPEVYGACLNLGKLNGQQIFRIWDVENQQFSPYFFTEDTVFTDANAIVDYRAVLYEKIKGITQEGLPDFTIYHGSLQPMTDETKPTIEIIQEDSE